ncbi:MAG: sugar porter family MFS transporter [Planctomycetota bacterium]
MNVQRPIEDQGSSVYLVTVVLVATLGGLLFGYDTAVISGAIGFLAEHFELDATMKGWAASSALLGCFIGVAFAGELNDRLGRKAALIIAAFLFLVSAVGTAVPATLNQFVGFRALGGLGVGIASMTSPMYIAEISPAKIRGRMVSLNQLAIVSGMLVVYFVNYYIAAQGNAAWNASTGWRWMFGSEAVPALLLLVLLVFAPESPRFLLAVGEESRAREILRRVDGEAHANQEVEEIRAALAEETGSLGQLLQPGVRQVLVIGISLAVLQQVTGINVFLYYAPEILKSLAGAETDVALLQTVMVGAVNLAFTLLAIGTVDKIGRKPLMIAGAAGMGICLTAIGLAVNANAIGAWVLGFMLGYIACFAMSVGPVTWVILSEIFPTKVRGRALAIATFFLWLANFVVSQTFPMLDEHPWLVEQFNHAFPFWVYAAFCLVLVMVMIRLVPETKGKTLEELEHAWLQPR